METDALVIDNETGGGKPVKCALSATDKKVRISYGGSKGFTIAVSVDDIRKAIMECASAVDHAH